MPGKELTFTEEQADVKHALDHAPDMLAQIVTLAAYMSEHYPIPRGGKIPPGMFAAVELETMAKEAYARMLKTSSADVFNDDTDAMFAAVAELPAEAQAVAAYIRPEPPCCAPPEPGESRASKRRVKRRELAGNAARRRTLTP